MKTGLALFFLIGLGLVFDVKPLWPSSSDFKPEHYEHIELTKEDTVMAIDAFKKTKFLNDIGFYVNPFPFSNQRLTKKTFVYFLFAHIVFSLVFILWWLDASDENKPFVGMYAFFTAGDTIDFWLTYNSEYGTPWVTYNILFVVLYGFFLIVMGWRRIQN